MNISYSFSLPVVPPPSARQKAERLEREMVSLPQVDCPVRHYFAPGVFAREITLKAGTVLVGAVHRMANLAVLSKGRLLLVTDGEPVEISAPCTLTVKAGAKNAATALEDSVWTNFLPNPADETDINKLVEMFTESTNAELLGGCNNKQILLAQERKESPCLSE